MAVTEPEFNPVIMHDISVVIDAASGGGQEFRNAIQSFQFVPSSSIVTTTGGRPNQVFTDQAPPTWTCVIKFLQDIASSASLLNYLLLHAGQRKQVDFHPGAGVQVSAMLVLAVPPIGGDMNTWLDAQVTCGVVGAPQLANTP